ncbi:MAG: hypothetical protein HKO65_13065, partial [Gemmatimonadetes bacterium]|nr:hypothetical protein [Gemmatimonadota bacterium]
MRTPLLLGVILASVPLQNLAGQEISEIALGERIRVSAPECDLPKKEGSFRGVEGGSLVLRMGSNESICPLSAVNRLEIHQGRRHWGKNTAVGALIGGLGGAAIGASTG